MVNVAALLTAIAALVTFSGPVARALDSASGHPMDDRYALKDSVAAALARQDERFGRRIDRLTDALCDPKILRARVCSDIGPAAVQAGSPRP